MERSAKNSIVGALCVAALLLAAAPNVFAKEKAEEKKEDNVLYVLGVALSQGLGAFGLSDDDLDQVVDGLKDGVQGKTNHINPRDYMPQIQALQQERAEAKRIATIKAAADADRLVSGLYLPHVPPERIEAARSALARLARRGTSLPMHITHIAATANATAT